MRSGAGDAARRSLLVAGLAAIVAGTFLPWLRSGTVDRNSYRAGDVLRRIEQLPAALGFLMEIWRFLPLACAVAAAHPVRIAAQKVDGRWYPSLLYTMADDATTAAGLGTPDAADAIPARGANSPDAAVRQMLTDLLGGQVEQAIELTSPDEDAVLHDYGKYIVDRVRYRPAPARINSISFIDSAISGGTQVSLKSIDVTVHGQRVSVRREGNCVEFRGMGKSSGCAAAASRG